MEKRRSEHALQDWTGIVLTSNNEVSDLTTLHAMPAFSA